MKKKVVKLNENDLSRIVKKVLNEQVENPEMSGSWHRTRREKDVRGVFGEYGEDVLPVVIRYMRKNPDAVLRRLSKMYPEIYMRHIPAEGPLDEATTDTVTTYNPKDDEDIDVAKAIKSSDDEDVSYNDDGTISVKS
jgi:DUF1009 family protein